jgi:hypothetical protein
MTAACATCRRWTRGYAMDSFAEAATRAWGVCHLDEEDGAPIRNTDRYESIETHETFACNQHQERET